MPATEGTWRETSSRDTARHWPIARVASFSVLLALALGVFLLSRRATGALTAPLQPWPLVVTALSLVVWSWFVRLTWPTTIWLPSVTVLLFAIACSYPGQRPIDWLVWLAAGAAVLVPRKSLFPARPRRPVVPGSPANLSERREQLLQELQRYRSDDGRETVRGLLLAEFAPGERNTTLFVAFCPPFERLPNVEVEVADDSTAAVSNAQVLHNGAQIDVRLRSPSACQQNVIVQLFAAEPADAA